jgi:hypothetical protein
LHKITLYARSFFISSHRNYPTNVQPYDAGPTLHRVKVFSPGMCMSHIVRSLRTDCVLRSHGIMLEHEDHQVKSNMIVLAVTEMATTTPGIPILITGQYLIRTYIDATPSSARDVLIIAHPLGASTGLYTTLSSLVEDFRTFSQNLRIPSPRMRRARSMSIFVQPCTTYPSSSAVPFDTAMCLLCSPCRPSLELQNVTIHGDPLALEPVCEKMVVFRYARDIASAPSPVV